MGEYFIGIDLGGTSIKLGITDATGHLLHKDEMPTRPAEGAKAGMERMAAGARQLAESAGIAWGDVKGLGLGAPGFLDLAEGKILRLTNIPWENVPIRDGLQDLLGIPVVIDNDANVAALGEAWSGAGAGLTDMVLITLGTGVGGGVIAGGRLIHGAGGMAGEVGHIPVEPGGVPCGCGQQGCLETISSATGLVRLATAAVGAGRATPLKSDVEAGTITTRDIVNAAREGDPVALEVIDTAVDALARVMAILTLVNNPAAFVIGGGVSGAGETLFTPLRRAFGRHALPDVARGVQIIPAQLGNDAGMIGAAGLTAKGTMMG
ncbi:ROK family glucokinase [Kroppenstedtia eburnea]|uniref:Glucokinase n=1 Tax=Kroppenstedtia eburnea TaxID=714067 RepID=A0A1N7JXH7_9BACL|nr:ROK family glucokinase [Kroppenstedtia eburnea]QKI83399.1 ROK family glucokinase [Kroppenstedtia eburnea]SIS53991.1 glucokinase [Kroppenstedtia eburnea]